MSEPRRRRLIIRDVNLHMVTDTHNGITVERSFDLTGIDHANARAPLFANVEQQCDLGHWHQVSAVQLPPWGRADD